MSGEPPNLYLFAPTMYCTLLAVRRIVEQVEEGARTAQSAVREVGTLLTGMMREIENQQPPAERRPSGERPHAVPSPFAACPPGSAGDTSTDGG